MTYKEFHTAFNIQLDKAESISHPAFISKEKDYWINTAIRNLVKTRFSGTNPLRKGFQQDQKRTDDLRFLVKTATFVTAGAHIPPEPTSYSYFHLHTTANLVITEVKRKVDGVVKYSGAYPEDYWFSVGENIDVKETVTANNITTNVYRGTYDLTECTVDNITSHINNSLSDYHLRNNRAKPLRWISDGQIYIYKDTDYEVDNYQLVYLSKPQVFERISTGPNYNEDTEYTGMPEHLHDEIVAYAVRLALGSIGDDRYQIQSAENQIIE